MSEKIEFSQFGGLMAATITPFDFEDRLNLHAVASHVDFLIEGGVQGLCPAGTTGEMLYLSEDEKAQLIQSTVVAANGRVPVIAGVWALRAHDVALLAKKAELASADAVFLPPPIYYPANDDVIYEWYANVKNNTSLPIFAYNIPGYAANAISFECIERLVVDGIIAGVKDSSGKADQMAGLVEVFGSRIQVEAASDAFVTGARKLGANGFISAIANIAPSLVRKVWDGDESLQPKIDGIRNAIKLYGGIAAIKFIANELGFEFGSSRIPSSTISTEGIEKLRAISIELKG